ncbi:MAG TPA: antibiotic biosynthesis monooxygenase [Dehalococcoidia bacterium]
MFVAMNNFKIAPGREADFERQWRERDSYLKDVPGVVQFSLLKGEDQGEYVSHTIWESRDAFVAWTRSPSFIAAHRQGSVAGVVQGPPHLKIYDSIIVEQYGTLAGSGS